MNVVVKMHDNKPEIPIYSYEEIMNIGGLFTEVGGVISRLIWVIKHENSSQIIILHHKYGINLPLGDWSTNTVKYVKYDGKVTIELEND